MRRLGINPLLKNDCRISGDKHSVSPLRRAMIHHQLLLLMNTETRYRISSKDVNGCLQTLNEKEAATIFNVTMIR